jgi:CrcB protein
VKLLLVFVGGGLGSLARFYVSLFAQKFAGNFPYGTLLSNITASLILGMVAGYLLGVQNNNLRWLIIVGFCGGFSTFSSFSFETFELFKTSQFQMAFLNIFGNTLLCLFAIFCGLFLGRNL